MEQWQNQSIPPLENKKQENRIMKTLILLLMSYTVLFSLTGKEITITEGLWYISFPENSGEIKASEMAYRFNPDGSAEMVLSERAVKLREKKSYCI